MLRGDDVRRYGKRLVDPSFGPGDLALLAVFPGISGWPQVA
jgi:hypothetical protein